MCFFFLALDIPLGSRVDVAGRGQDTFHCCAYIQGRTSNSNGLAAPDLLPQP